MVVVLLRASTVALVTIGDDRRLSANKGTSESRHQSPIVMDNQRSSEVQYLKWCAPLGFHIFLTIKYHHHLIVVAFDSTLLCVDVVLQ